MKPKLPRFLALEFQRFSRVASIVIPSVARFLRPGCSFGARDLLLLTLALVGSLVLCASAHAQQARTSDLASLQGYSAVREGSLVGTVVKYDPASSTPPIGAHVLIQTASGQVDVHVGDANLLEANHLQLNLGDNIRIVGEPVALGNTTYFAARIVQKGTQAVAVRNIRGFLLKPELTPEQKEALRGVR